MWRFWSVFFDVQGHDPLLFEEASEKYIWAIKLVQTMVTEHVSRAYPLTLELCELSCCGFPCFHLALASLIASARMRTKSHQDRENKKVTTRGVW